MNELKFSATNRALIQRSAFSEPFDLLVIGGGITGAGIALDAITRGLKVLLVEKKDFAWGTSSRSTKLIHGGLRYLKQMEFGLVHEVGVERAIVHKNAPHIVLPEKMLLPIIEEGSLGKMLSSLGLWVYDRLANVEQEERRKTERVLQSMRDTQADVAKQIEDREGTSRAIESVRSFATNYSISSAQCYTSNWLPPVQHNILPSE